MHFPRLSLSVLYQLLFLHPHVPLNHWRTVCLEAAFLHVLFCTNKDLCTCHKYLSCWSCQCPLNQALAPFFYQCPAHIVHNTTCFVCWFNVKVKRNFNGIWYNHMISWNMWHFNVNVLTWVCYIGHVDLGYMFSLAFESKLCSMFYRGI